MLTPDVPLSTAIVDGTDRGTRDYFFDLSVRPYLEASERLNGAGAIGRVISSDATTVEVVDSQPNDTAIGTAGIEQGVWMQLRALKESNAPKFPLRLEYAGNSGSSGTIDFTIQLVTNDPGK